MSESEKRKKVVVPRWDRLIDTTPIDEPHSHDVLCGRGGLTNQHPGNEWFRRLVKSNRPLYKSCPKHTKLLVAKAIVQAVDAQDPPGRFLERTASKGAWVQIPYQKAVDKTSQALREKEVPSSEGTDKDKPVSAKSSDVDEKEDKSVQFARETAEAIRKDGRRAGGLALFPLTKVALESAGLENTVSMKSLDAASNVSKVWTPPPQFFPSVADMNGAAPSAGMPVALVDGFRKRKAVNPSHFAKPDWWNRGTPLSTGISFPLIHSITPFRTNNTTNSNRNPRVPNVTAEQQLQGMNNDAGTNKRRRVMVTSTPSNFNDEEDSPLPLPPTEPLESRQSSLFRFLGSSGIFGRQNQGNPIAMLQQDQHQGMVGNIGKRASIYFQQSGLFGFSRNHMDSAVETELVGADSASEPGAVIGRMEIEQRGFEVTSPQPAIDIAADVDSETFEEIEPLPLTEDHVVGNPNEDDTVVVMDETTSADMLTTKSYDEDNALFPPPAKGLTSQVSDWLSSFFPTGKEPSNESAEYVNDSSAPVEASTAVPPVNGDRLERSGSSSIFGLIESPSIFLTALKSGMSAILGVSDDLSPSEPPIQPAPSSEFMGQPSNSAPIGLLGEPCAAQKRNSLLDDYEETPMEMKLRDMKTT